MHRVEPVQVAGALELEDYALRVAQQLGIGLSPRRPCWQTLVDGRFDSKTRPLLLDARSHGSTHL